MSCPRVGGLEKHSSIMLVRGPKMGPRGCVPSGASVRIQLLDFPEFLGVASLALTLLPPLVSSSVITLG